MKINGETLDRYNDSSHLGFGFEILPATDFAAKYYQKLSYRIGYYYDVLNYKDINDNVISENGFTIGLTYERRFSELLGIGGFYEYAAGDFDKWSIGVPLFIHPHEGWRFVLAPGLEHRHGDDEFLFRTGVAYEFELSERWVMVPEFNVDFVDGEEAFAFGLSFGFGF